MKSMFRRWAVGALALLALTTPLRPAQYDFGTIDPADTSGTELSLILNQWRNAVHTFHSGATRPAYAQTGTFWIDTSATPNLLKQYNGAGTDITLGPLEAATFSRLARGGARPSWAAEGTLWVNTTGGTPTLNYYNGTTDITMGPISTQAFGLPVGSEISWPGPKAPAGWLMSAGQPVSRTTYAALYDVLTVTVACTTANGSTAVTGLNEDLTALGLILSRIEGPGIAPGTTLSALTVTTATLSANAGGGFGSGTCRIFPHGNGDGSSTFNLPDRRGRMLAGRDTMNGSDGGRLQVYFGDYLAATGGQEQVSLAIANMPAHDHGSTTSTTTNGDHSHSYTYRDSEITASNQDISRVTGYWRSTNTGSTSNNGAHNHSVTIPSQGSGTAFTNMPPTIMTNYIIKF